MSANLDFNAHTDDRTATTGLGASIAGQFSVFGDPVVPTIGESNDGAFSSPAATFNLVSDAPKGQLAAYGPPHVYIPIGPVILDLSLQIVLTAGMNTAISGSVSDQCDVAIPNPALVSLSFSTLIEPQATAALVGSAGVGWVVAEVGADVSVDLLTVQLPVTVGLQMLPADANGPQLQFMRGAQIVFETLDGHVDVFAQICDPTGILGCARWDDQLFSWNGYMAPLDLGSATTSFDMLSLGLRWFHRNG